MNCFCTQISFKISPNSFFPITTQFATQSLHYTNDIRIVYFLSVNLRHEWFCFPRFPWLMVFSFKFEVWISENDSRHKDNSFFSIFILNASWMKLKLYFIKSRWATVLQLLRDAASRDIFLYFSLAILGKLHLKTSG